MQTAETLLEMVLTNAVMEGETGRHGHANAGEEFQNRYCFWTQRKSIAVSIQSANDISDEAPDLGILVDEGYVSDDRVGEDGSEQGDVVNDYLPSMRTENEV